MAIRRPQRYAMIRADLDAFIASGHLQHYDSNSPGDSKGKRWHVYWRGGGVTFYTEQVESFIMGLQVAALKDNPLP